MFCDLMDSHVCKCTLFPPAVTYISGSFIGGNIEFQKDSIPTI